MAGGILCCFVFEIVQKAYVLCHLKKKPEENTGSSDIPVHGEAVAGGFSPGISFNGLLSELPIIQENSAYGYGILIKTHLQVMEMTSLTTCPLVSGRASLPAILLLILEIIKWTKWF